MPTLTIRPDANTGHSGQLFVITDEDGNSTGRLTFGEVLETVARVYCPSDWPGWVSKNMPDHRMHPRNPYIAPLLDPW